MLLTSMNPHYVSNESAFLAVNTSYRNYRKVNISVQRGVSSLREQHFIRLKTYTSSKIKYISQTKTKKRYNSVHDKIKLRL